MAGHERETETTAGFGRSDKQTFTIPNGNTGSNIGNLNLGRNYAYIILRCDDCQYIQAATTLGIKVAMDEAEQMNSLYEFNSSSTFAILAPTLPTSGSFQALIVPAFGIQYIHFTLSKAASGGSVVLTVYGFAESVRG